jgi:hypothetical protein
MFVLMRGPEESILSIEEELSDSLSGKDEQDDHFLSRDA